MAKRRRHASLGSAPAEHRAAAMQALRSLQRTLEHLGKGRPSCQAQLDFLIDAERELARYRTHAAAVGTPKIYSSKLYAGRRARRADAALALQGQLDDYGRRFRTSCVRSNSRRFKD